MNRKKYLLLPIFILMIISILNIFKAKYLDIAYNYLYIKQIIWYAIGFLIIIFNKRKTIERLFNMSFYIYILSILLLILVLFLGKEINGSKAWFSFSFFSFQPSEFTRLSLALFLSYFSSNYDFKKNSELKYIILVFIITLIPSFFVFLEPDTGAIIFYFIIFLSILWNSKISKKWFILIFGILFLFIIIFLYLFYMKQDLLIRLIGTSFFYRVDRLINFYNNTGYQIENTLTTLANSSFWGTKLNRIILYIPEGHTDFIFAFNLGNFGIASLFIVLICYYIIDLFFIIKAKKIKEIKKKYFINSFISVFLFQELYNIFMNLNMLPIMGIPLPFLSYGGTTLIIYFLFISIIIN